MRKAISLFLMFSILLATGNLFAKEKKGADLIIQKNNGIQVRGELIAVKKNSLVLLGLSPMVDVTVDLAEIKMIRVVRKSKLLFGAGIGLLTGYVAGSVIVSTDTSGSLGLSETDIVASIVFWGFAIIGTIVGATAGTDEKILIEGKTDSEIRKILDKLRKHARVKNAQ